MDTSDDAFQAIQEEAQEAERSHAELQALVADSRKEPGRGLAALWPRQQRIVTGTRVHSRDSPNLHQHTCTRGKASTCRKERHIILRIMEVRKASTRANHSSKDGKGFGKYGKGKEVQAMMTVDTTFWHLTLRMSTTSTPPRALLASESVVDTCATATAGGRWLLQQLCQAIMTCTTRCSGDIYTGVHDRPWLQYGNGSWGRALFRLTIYIWR